MWTIWKLTYHLEKDEVRIYIYSYILARTTHYAFIYDYIQTWKDCLAVLENIFWWSSGTFSAFSMAGYITLQLIIIPCPFYPLEFSSCLFQFLWHRESLPTFFLIFLDLYIHLLLYKVCINKNNCDKSVHKEFALRL